MHESSFEKMEAFVRVHLDAYRGRRLDILDFGSQVVDDQGLSYRGLFNDEAWRYRGLDIEAGSNVDIVVANAYDWSELDSESVDLVISGQALEHVEYFWASMFEIVRVLKPGGLATVIAPSGGFEHRYPVDCWRFYRDGFDALARHVDCDVVDAFTDWGNLDWEDSVLIARKPRWDGAGRARFHQRSILQRALLNDGVIDPDELVAGWINDDEPSPPSVLSTVQSGALTAELSTARANRLSAAEAEDAAAKTHAAENAKAREAELDDLRARAADQSVPVSDVVAAYGRIRARVAELAGERGRSAYKRLRRRN